MTKDASRPPLSPPVIAEVLREVARERAYQHVKWGQQDHPNGTSDAFTFAAKEARQSCEEAFTAGLGTWRDILAEEVYEAFAEEDPARLRVELIQVAAVAAAWIEAIDRASTKGDAVESKSVLRRTAIQRGES